MMLWQPTRGILQPNQHWRRPQDPGGGGGTVSLISAGTKQYGSPGTSKSYTGITVSTGNALVVTVDWGFSGSAPTSATATWDTAGGSPTNQAMSLIIGANGSSNTRAALYGLISPTAGNKTLTISWTNSAEIFVSAIEFSGVNGAGGTTSFPNAVSDATPGISAVVTVTSATGHYVVGCSSGANNGVAGTPTELFYDNTSGTFINAAAAYGTGAATVNVGVSGNNSGVQVNVGCDVAP